MAEIGQLGAQTYRMSFPEQQLAQQEAQQLAVQPASFNQQKPKDPLAYRGKLNRDYYTNYGLLESFVKEMSKQGIDVTVPDFSQPGGGELFQQYQILSAASMAAADALSSEMKAEDDLRQPLAEGRTRMKPGVQQEGLYYSDPNNFYPTAIDPIVTEANKRLGDNFYTQGDVNAVNTAVRDPRVVYFQDKLNPNSPNYDPNNIEVNQRNLQALLSATRSTYGPSLNDGSGNNAGISAYVRKLSEVALGNNFEAGSKYDENGNRVDISRPSEFVERQLGFTKDGKKFILDRFERTVLPQGGFKVDAVDAQGNRQPVDPNNITGTLRNFIETNEGAGALKDLNNFFRSQGFNTATQSVPASIYAQSADATSQTLDAPKVKEVREKIDKSLDALSTGGVGRWLKNVAATVATGVPVDVNPTDLAYQTSDGRNVIVTKTGDGKFSFKNYNEFYGKAKGGVIDIGGVKYPVKGTFEDIPKTRILQILEQFGVVSTRVKNSKGQEVNVPLNNRTPEELKAEELIRKYSQ